jgi:hypothetical protein
MSPCPAYVSEHIRTQSGLPDGIFSNQTSQFGYILEGLAMEDVGIFYGTLVYFVTISFNLWLFGIFFPVLVCCTKKIRQHCT